MMQDVTRRQALKLGAASLPVLAGYRFPELALGQRSPVPGIRKPLPPGLLIPQKTNAEMRWSAMRGTGYLTPVDRFFVRNHTETPRIDARTWRLKLFGSGLRGRPTRRDPVRMSLRELERLESRTVITALECAGNGRTGFAQQGREAEGTEWALGAIGLARWRGVLLRDVLERAGLRGSAVDVMPEGLDGTVEDDDGVDQGHVRRPLPIAKALDDALVAFEMNGRDLPLDHGFPARLIVPGWVGIASIKWLGFLEVADRRLESYWNTTQYRFVGPTYPEDSPPLTVQPLKSAFELDAGASFRAGQPVTLTGRSWSGRTSPPQRVEVSTDDGETWRQARLRAPNREREWVRWSIDWTPERTGQTNLIARATDRAGRTQPARQPFNANGYQFGALFRTAVKVT